MTMPRRIGFAPTLTPISTPVTETKPDLKLPAAFITMPKDTRFQGEDDDETIILLLRAHLITNVPWIVAAILMLLAPVFFFPLLFMTNVLPPLPAGFKFVSIIFWYLGTTTYALLNFLNWYFNAGIITDRRVVDIDWNSLTHREVTIAMLSKIQDVTPSLVGVLGGIFDYGHVHIQTAGTLPNIEFLSIPHPQSVANKIQELTQQS